MPLVYQVVPVATVRDRLNRDTPQAADRAVKSIALTRLEALESARKQNTLKGRAPALALLLEALAVGSVGIAVAKIL